MSGFTELRKSLYLKIMNFWRICLLTFSFIRN